MRKTKYSSRGNKSDSKKKKILIILGVSFAIAAIAGGTVAGILSTGSEASSEIKEPTDPNPGGGDVTTDPDPDPGTGGGTTDPEPEQKTLKSIKPKQIKDANEMYFNDSDKTTIEWENDLKKKVKIGISKKDAASLQERDYDKLNEANKLIYEADYARVMHIPKKYARKVINTLRRNEEGKPVLSLRSGGMIHEMGSGGEDTTGLAKFYEDSMMKSFFDEEKKTNLNVVPFVSEIATDARVENDLSNKDWSYEDTKNEALVKKYIYDNALAREIWNKKDGTNTISINLGDAFEVGGTSSSKAISAGNHMSIYFTEAQENITLNTDVKYFGNLLVKTEKDGDWVRIQSNDGMVSKTLTKTFDKLYAVRFLVTADAMDAQIDQDLEGSRLKAVVKKLYFTKSTTKTNLDLRLVASQTMAFNRFFLEGFDINVMLASGEMNNLKGYIAANNQSVGYDNYYVDTRSNGNVIRQQMVFTSAFLKKAYGRAVDYYLTMAMRAQSLIGLKKPYSSLLNKKWIEGANNAAIEKKGSITPIFVYDEFIEADEFTTENNVKDYKAVPKLQRIGGITAHELYHALADDYGYLYKNINWYNILASFFNDLDPLKIGSDQKRKDAAYKGLTDYFLSWMFHSYHDYPQYFLGFTFNEEQSGDRFYNAVNEQERQDGDNIRVSIPKASFEDKAIEEKFWDLAKSLTADGNLDKTFHKARGGNLKGALSTGQKTKDLANDYGVFETTLSENDYFAKVRSTLYQFTKEGITDKEYTTTVSNWLKNISKEGANSLTNKQLRKTMQEMGGGALNDRNNLWNIWFLHGMPLVDGSSMSKEASDETNITDRAKDIQDLSDSLIRFKKPAVNTLYKENRERLKLNLDKLINKANKTQADIERVADLQYAYDNNRLKLSDNTEVSLDYLWGWNIWQVEKSQRPVHPWMKFVKQGDKTTVTPSLILDPDVLKQTNKLESILPESMKDNEEIQKSYDALYGISPANPFWGIAKEKSWIYKFKTFVEKALARKRSRQQWTANNGGASRYFVDRTSESPEGDNTDSRPFNDKDNPVTVINGRTLSKILISMFTGVDNVSKDSVGDSKTDEQLWENMISIISTNIASTAKSFDQIKDPKLQPYVSAKSKKNNLAVKRKGHLSPIFEENEEVSEDIRVKADVSIKDSKFEKGGVWEFKRPKIVVVNFTTKDGKEIEEWVNMGYTVSLKDRYGAIDIPQANGTTKRVNNYVPGASRAYPVFGRATSDFTNPKNYAMKQRNYLVGLNEDVRGEVPKGGFTMNVIPAYEERLKKYVDRSNGRGLAVHQWVYTLGVTSTSNVGGERTYHVEVLQDTLLTKPKGTKVTTTRTNMGIITKINSVRLLTDEEIKRGRHVSNANATTGITTQFLGAKDPATDFNSHETILLGNGFTRDRDYSMFLYNDLRMEPIIINKNAPKESSETVSEEETKTPYTWDAYTPGLGVLSLRGDNPKYWTNFNDKKWTTQDDSMENLPYWYKFDVFDDQK